MLTVGGYAGSSLSGSSEVVGYPDCQIPHMPVPTRGHTAVSTPLPIVCGGVADGYTDRCYHYHPSTGWSTHSTLNYPRYGPNGVDTQDGVFILGGYPSSVKNKIEFLAHGSTTWRTLSEDIPGAGVYRSCVVALNSQSILVIGGSYDKNQVMQFNTTTRSWFTWPNLPISVYEHACLNIGDKIIIAGGRTSEYIASTLILDTTTRQTTYGGDMSTSRTWYQLGRMGGKVVAIGGYDGSKRLETIEELDESNFTWSVSAHRLNIGRSHFALLSIPGPASSLCG